MTIAAVETTIIDVPTIRAHALSFGTVRAQSYVLVRLRDADGAEGWGEASTIGGPSWSEESVEGIKATIDAYLAPAVIGLDPRRFSSLGARMGKAARGNPFARGAVEMAAIDLVARRLGLPAHDLLGGRHHDGFELIWTLASGDPGRDLEEGQAMLAERRHRVFKVKIGMGEPAADVALLSKLRRGLPAEARLRVDVNQAWDEITARRVFPALAEAGVELVEQPLPRWDHAGAARLRAATGMAVMADEAAGSPQEMLAIAAAGAADVVALKLGKSAGPLGCTKVAAVAEAAGLPMYGGCMLDTALGTAAAAHVFAAIPVISWGCELFGPLLLTEPVTETPLGFGDFRLRVPDGPGWGVRPDAAQLAKLRRGAS